MGDGSAENGRGAGGKKTLGGATQGCSGGGDIIDEQHAMAPHLPARRKASSRQLLSLGAGASCLAAKTVALQGVDQGAFNGSRDLGADQVGCIESSAKPADVVRWNVGDRRDFVEPGCDGDPGRQADSQRAGDFIVTPVLERENRLPKNTVVFAPQNAGRLCRRRSDAVEAGLEIAVGGHAAARAAGPGHGVEAAAARAAQAAVISGEHVVACHAQSRQQNSPQSGSHSDSHGLNPSPHPGAGQGCLEDSSSTHE